MPEHLDKREETESAIAAALLPVFTEARIRAERGESIDWVRVQTGTRIALEENLEQMFTVAFLLMLMMADVESSPESIALAQVMSKQYAAAAASNIGANLAVNAHRDLQAGAIPERVFSDARAESIAVTETTRSISAGESAARNRLPPSVGVPRQGAEVSPGGTGVPTSIYRGGLVAIWATERDERVCPICSPLDNKREEEWVHLFVFGPPAHPRCRCSLRYEKVI